MEKNDLKKRIDIHFHALGSGKNIDEADNDIYREFDDNHMWFIRLLHSSIENELKELGIDFNNDGEITTNEYFDRK